MDCTMLDQIAELEEQGKPELAKHLRNLHEFCPEHKSKPRPVSQSRRESLETRMKIMGRNHGGN